MAEEFNDELNLFLFGFDSIEIPAENVEAIEIPLEIPEGIPFEMPVEAVIQDRLQRDRLNVMSHRRHRRGRPPALFRLDAEEVRRGRINRRAARRYRNRQLGLQLNERPENRHN